MGMVYLQLMRKAAPAKASTDQNRPSRGRRPCNPWVALSPLVVVGVMKTDFHQPHSEFYGKTHEFALSQGAKPIVTKSARSPRSGRSRRRAAGHPHGVCLRLKPVTAKFADGSKAAIAGSSLHR
jgi:hypothetical protein